jgi:hypothetical protein
MGGAMTEELEPLRINPPPNRTIEQNITDARIAARLLGRTILVPTYERIERITPTCNFRLT